MAAEGEFAFVIAVFGVEQGLIDRDLYASVVLISYYNKTSEEAVRKAAEQQMEIMGNEDKRLERERQLREGIQNDTTIFLVIQTQSESKWGLLHTMMSCMNMLGLDIIDHRSWHPRGVNTTLVNEIYCKDVIKVSGDGTAKAINLDERMLAIQTELENVIDQPEASKVKVSRWFPGVVEEITEQDREGGIEGPTISERLLSEAANALENKRNLHMSITQAKPVEAILKEYGADEKDLEVSAPPNTSLTNIAPRPRRRQKMRSTPVVGGGLFEDKSNEVLTLSRPARREKYRSKSSTKDPFSKPTATTETSSSERLGVLSSPIGHRRKIANHTAELIVGDEVISLILNDDTLDRVRGGGGLFTDAQGISMDSRGIPILPSHSAPVTNLLQGYVRNPQTVSSMHSLQKISEQETDSFFPKQTKATTKTSSTSDDVVKRMFEGIPKRNEGSLRPVTEYPDDDHRIHAAYASGTQEAP
eukprot:CAMPEP_0118681660 /NCGR_PEP_ID=MMETSP0800-20121206/5062_1 /TAXON_ID=210618 ORGANISM="Striatella unipunctata, Strain CCMP2910" /NCGR_SAMPLE_ID=MMETSP0800 /ASSEMBLY_ACC=CAM_ASM_000638 /LENGTH=473 /DNA_ID=CAMNT_0006577981 /DNA_START=44 /DNA_END=1466 /DNA_ORIENTATION=-